MKIEPEILAGLLALAALFGAALGAWWATRLALGALRDNHDDQMRQLDELRRALNA